MLITHSTPAPGVRYTRPQTNFAVDQAQDPDRDGWDDIIRPEPGEGEPVDPGKRKGEGVPRSIAEVREKLDTLTFHDIDPYVATVASGVAAGQVDVPGRGESKVRIHLEPYFDKRIELFMGTHNGPGAPMLAILPGTYGDGKGSHTNTLKKMALERGMNYVAIPNSLSMQSLRDDPRDHPGNPRISAEASYKALKVLKEKFPSYFQNVSVAGYSYGALHGANLVRLEEELEEKNPGMQRVINGGLVSISPPENLADSMNELDKLREYYKEGAGSIITNGLKYKKHVRKFGYDGFLQSDLSKRGEGENITEIKISDKYGSRDGLKDMVDRVDYDFGQKRLPMNKPEFWDGTEEQRREWQRQHIQMLNEMTYDEYSNEYMAKDQWIVEQGLTPDEMASKYSFSNAMKVIDDTPVMVLVSADDYILNADNVNQFRELEKNPGDLEAVKIFDHGGHVGLSWNPEIQNAMADFLYKPPVL
ncbi:MAG: hypothetical protein KC800_22935 [Candidatus Eremiobacteraeota bacterium]|nr:hypothetical protein [Candidatus Eremiobacteraeota bacterium]